MFDTSAVPIFTGQNYSAWKFKFQLLMMERGLWGFFDGTEKKPNDESGIAAWKKKDQKAFATLISRIGINLVSAVHMCIKLEASAHEAWKRLETIHVNKTLHGKILARNAFYTVKMRAGESMHEYATRVEELGETFMDLGGTLQPKARAAIYLGLAANERAWRVWDLGDKRVVTSRDVVFDEDKFPMKEQPTPQLTVVLPAREEDEAVEVTSQVEKEAENGGGENEESDDDVVEVPPTEAATSSTPSSLPLALTREQRTRRPNTKHNDYAMVAVGELDEERAAYCFATLGDDPRTHIEALASPDAPLWNQAMEKELASIKENDVFELVDPPKGAYLMGCKWLNYRPITLLNFTYKVLAKVMAGRMKRVLHQVISPEQYGFIPGRRLSDAVAMVADVIDMGKNDNEDWYMLLVDFQKSFDSVSRDFLFEVLRNMGFPERFVKWIEGLHENTTTKLLINGWLGEGVNVVSGVRQGCLLAPYLFLCAVEPLAKEVERESLGLTRSQARVVCAIKFPGFGFTAKNESEDNESYAGADSATTVFPAEACDELGGEFCNAEGVFAEVKLESKPEPVVKQVEGRDVGVVDYDGPKTVFPGEACDELGGEFCEPDYQEGVGPEKKL
ncbi:unnamed protein product [Closterium sp. NIES-65]|nr:unnamed protein product [Closterium sp. NIES-65]